MGRGGGGSSSGLTPHCIVSERYSQACIQDDDGGDDDDDVNNDRMMMMMMTKLGDLRPLSLSGRTVVPGDSLVL